MQNKGVAFGDYLNHFSKKNTTILHSAFSILHLRVSALNWKLTLQSKTKYVILAESKGDAFVKKNTAEIVKELGLCPDFQTFYQENKDYMISGDLSVLLAQLLERKGLKKAQVIKNAELSEVYGYQIFSGVRVPERKKLLCLAFAMNLNVEEVQKLLKCAGYPQLYVKLPFDSVLLYGFCKGLTVLQINELLYEYGLETLG